MYVCMHTDAYIRMYIYMYVFIPACIHRVTYVMKQSGIVSCIV